jgi:hypothetical protein
MMLAAFKDYLPVSDLWKIVVVSLGIAVVAPSAAALAINGFDSQSDSRRAGSARAFGRVQIGCSVLVLAGLIAAGILALVNG